MPEWERSEGVSVQRLLFPQYHIIRGILEKIPPKMSGSAHSKYFYYSWLETASTHKHRLGCVGKKAGM